MLELTKTQTTAGLTELRLVMPRDKADLIADALRSLLLFSGQEMQIKEEAEDEKLYPDSYNIQYKFLSRMNLKPLFRFYQA